VSDLLPAIFASMFINVAAPSGGTSGMAFLVNEASRRGSSRARSASGVLLVHVIDFATFALVLIVGLTILFLYHDLKVYEITAALLLLLIICGLTGVLVMGIYQPQRIGGWFTWIERQAARIAGRLRFRSPLQAGWAEKTSSEFSEASLAISTHPGRLSQALLLGLSAHAVDLLSLYALFLAFHEHVGPGILVAGFAMGILFWVVSITPQGIGVVEGMMTLTFVSLGVPVERATVISLSFRFLTFWVPFFLGFLILPRLSAIQSRSRPATGETSVHFMALLTAGMGLINLVSAVRPSLHGRIELLARISPLEVRNGGHLTAALAGFALLLLSAGLWRRKRTAWLLTLIVLGASVLSHLIKGLDYEEAGIAVFLGIWLYMLRPNFHARSDTPSIKQGFIILLASLSFTLLYGAAGFYLLDRHFNLTFGVWSALRQTFIMFTQFYDPGVKPLTGFGRYFGGSIYTVGGITLAYALWMLIRPVLLRQPASLEERERARRIIEQYGRTALARLTFLPDKQYLFTKGGSVVSYVVKGRVAITLGDPIGPFEDAADAIREYVDYCKRNDWMASFYQVLPDYLKDYVDAGFNAVCIGQEAIVNLADFTMEGKTNKGLRSGYNKIARLGYKAEVVPAPVPEQTLSEMGRISDEWLTSVKGTEKRFSLGWFDLGYLRSTPIMTVLDPQGSMIAFANLLPEYAKAEMTIDLMRHRDHMENGVMDFLFASLLIWARDNDLATFSLGLSSLAGIGESLDDPALERALHYFYEHVTVFYNFKGLHEYKNKFHPEWQPRYLIYPGAAALPSVVLGLIQADSGDDWLGGYIRK
jgi:phosphatidylglycerol lysyltransferase